MTPRVQSLLLKMSAAAKREHQAVVESAVKLDASEQQKLARILSTMSGHEIRLNVVINPSLIGGIKVIMGDWVMDLTLLSELGQMAMIASPTR